jgi:hypothetical protein
MVRLTAVAFVVAFMAMGCASRAPTQTASARDGQGAGFESEEQKLMACLDLRDHIVDLYADEYVNEQGLAMNEPERAAFRAGWAEELARKGTFERFEQSCFYSLTPRKYRCGMASQTTDGLVACMKLSAR